MMIKYQLNSAFALMRNMETEQPDCHIIQRCAK